MQAVVYGDVFMNVVYRTRPYEKVPGSVNALHEKWKNICIRQLTKDKVTMREFNKNIRSIVKEFDEIELLDIKKPRVGIVGEILVKFMPAANNYLVDLLEAEGCGSGYAGFNGLFAVLLQKMQTSKKTTSVLQRSLHLSIIL